MFNSFTHLISVLDVIPIQHFRRLYFLSMSGPVLSRGTPSTPVCVIFFGVRILLGTILGRFSIIYFRGLGLRIRVMVWVMVRVWSCGLG